jgi:hypothetical protein
LRYFLALNGYTTSSGDDERFEWMIRLAHGWGPDELGDAIRETLVPLDPGPVDAPERRLTRYRRRPRAVSEHARPGLEL